MKRCKLILSTWVIAAAAMGYGQAQAADVSHAPQTLVLDSGANFFGGTFGANNGGNTFVDKYAFTTAATSSIAAVVSALTSGIPDSIKITDFEIFNSGGFSLPGTKLMDGNIDLWTLSSAHAVPDAYYFLVSGILLTNAASSYSGAISVVAVPEPATYGMLLAGVGVLGLLARRRKIDVGVA